LFPQYHCCGGRNQKDFENKGSWKAAAADGANVLVPVACCKELPADANGVKACAGDATDTAYDDFSKITFSVGSKH